MKIYELLAEAKNWTRDAFARDATGRPVEPDAEEACCWCLVGALQKCYPEADIQDRVYDKLMSIINKTTGDENIAHFNDCATHWEVLKVTQEADV